jgi:type I restriction enzyme S subunit
MINFSSVKIKYIGTVVTGKTPSTKKASNFGNEYMFVTPSDLLNGYIIKSTERYLSSSGLQSISSNTIDGISVLVGCIGSDMGNVAITTEKCATNQQINAITNFKPGINPFYVYYWLLPKKKYLRQIAGCTTTPILPKTTFEEIEITIPEIHHQNKIVDILSSIDNKIELNNRIIVELEAMAKTIYDYWFVQFDFPNAEGKPYRSSGGEMVWNEQLKREIPKGWNVGTIKPFINVIRGVTYEKDDVQDAQSSGYICLLRANNIANGNINYDNVVYVKENKISKDQLLMQNDVFICMSSGSKDHIGKTAIVTADIGCSFGAFCSKIEIQSCAFSWLALYFRSKYFHSYIRNTCLGTNINNLNNDMLYNIVLPIPPEYVLQRFNAIIHPMIAKMGNTHVESIELEHLRDWLLPMLMNGQVTVE